MKHSEEISLTVSIFKEGKAFIAYSPALDISTAGRTLTEAKQNFDEMVRIFFEETQKRGTTEDALLSLGWEKRSSAGDWLPPFEIEHTTAKVTVPA